MESRARLRPRPGREDASESRRRGALAGALAHHTVAMRLAVTGGIAEGKSTVVGYLRDAGYSTASADAVAREVFGTSEVQSWIVERLGSSEPARVREAVASDASFRRSLNRLTHPRILHKLDRLRADVVEVPLLIEACLQSRFDRVWVVTCGPEEQLRRLAERLGGVPSAESLLATQLASRVKIPFADCIVRTNLPEETVRGYVLDAVFASLG